MRHLAVIPARSGSKGLKDKNIKRLNGKPLMAYTIEAAIQSNMFSRVVVSTDSHQYAQIAAQYGAEVPYLREDNLASDTASSWDVLRDVVSYYHDQSESFDTVTLLQPTSPLRGAKQIQEAFELYESKEAIAVVSVCKSRVHPQLLNTLPNDLSMDQFIDESHSLRRQDLETYYQLNGAIYILDIYKLVRKEKLYTVGTYAYLMNKRYSFDIDDELDFKLTNQFLNLYEHNKE
ncbi:cytidylyltransferase domain-containing protein [Alkalibacillus sp. S2W]|uniref:acylneuraminate cytidylyltransferase family protein n=1 Tax=Alkalibacillus sp. S2W TaxID=3386553 RepID=UPI00398D14E2